MTNPAAIWRHGRYHIAQLRLRPSTYTLDVDFEHLVCTRGDRVRIQHDVMLAGVGTGRVVISEVEAGAINLDEVIALDASKLYRMVIRHANGGFITHTLASGQGGELKRFLVTSSPTDMPGPGGLASIEEVGRELGVYRVLGVKPKDNLSATLTLVDDAPQIYQADSGAIPPFQSNVTAPVDPFTNAPTDVVVSQDLYYDGSEFFISATLNWRIARTGRARYFEVEYYDQAMARWLPGGTVQAPTTTLAVRGLRSGGYTFRVRSVFEDGSYSRWATTAAMQLDILTRPPATVPDFRISVRGDNTFLNWSPVTNVPIGFYEIRFVDGDNADIEWNAATPLIPRVEGTSIQVPSLVGTYLIKAVSVTGVRSLAASRIRSTIAELAGVNVVETLSEHPAFAGEKDGTVVTDNRLRLAASPDGQGAVVSGYYTFANMLDLGAVYTSRTTAKVEAVGEDLLNVMASWPTLASITTLDTSMPDEWGVELEVATTQGDPADPDSDWTGWQPFVVGDVTARGYRFRVRLYGQPVEGSDPPYTSVTPNVSRLSVVIDMPDRVIAREDVVVPVAGLQIVFDPPFIGLQGIATADQDLATGDRKVITNKGREGFFIRFFNSAGQPVARTIDYVAKGYGSRIQ